MNEEQCRFLDMRLDDLGLSPRICRVLMSKFVDGCVRDIVTMTDWEMLRIPGFGRVYLNNLKEVLSQKGLHLGMDEKYLLVDKPRQQVEYRFAIINGPTRAKLTAKALELYANPTLRLCTDWPVKDPLGFFDMIFRLPMDDRNTGALGTVLCREDRILVEETPKLSLYVGEGGVEVVLEYNLETRSGMILIRGEIPS